MEQIYIPTRKKWREWLAKNYDKKKEIWLIYYKKHTKKPRVLYDDAVEEALCFGWIDSTIKRIDEDRYMQKFTPRNLKSTWSELNIKRAKKMIAQGKMMSVGLEKYKKKKNNPTEQVIKSIQTGEKYIPSDFKKKLKQNKQAWEHFNKFTPTYKKYYIGGIISAKKEETRKRRMEKTVKLIEQNIKTFM